MSDKALVKVFIAFLAGAFLTMGVVQFSGAGHAMDDKVCVAWSATSGECTQTTTLQDLLDDARVSAK